MSWATIAPALLIPGGLYLVLPIVALPLGALILVGPICLAVAIFLGIRFDRPAVWWFLLPVAITELWIVIDSGVGMLVGLGLELLSIAWMIWAHRDYRPIAFLTTIFCLTFAWSPLLTFFGTI
ncbi:MAG: hypothetical protein ABI216_15225 [Devosia sp.]